MMNLEKMYDTQRALRERIEYDGDDRFEKLVLALYTELGELANEWRGFKFWSKDQEPRTFVIDGLQDGINEPAKNPLLEEYVDGLHFILELGIEAECEYYGNAIFTYDDVLHHFLVVYTALVNFRETYFSRHLTAAGLNALRLKFRDLQQLYLGLGIKLGFTFEQIEQAYYEKNKVNHERQNAGY